MGVESLDGFFVRHVVAYVSGLQGYFASLILVILEVDVSLLEA